ncbi:MAG TPA: helix-turn-helix transcriptional regulator [Tepidisphaeraceae bacterium]|nr:helix-turn-helix transcriptional regulator [Tepidisphaeraceae bacterium]
MIRNEAEYQQALDHIQAERQRFAEHAKAWARQGYTRKQITKLMEPLESFHEQLVEEVGGYERLKRGEFKEFENLEGLGQVLIGVRIARGMTQRELAAALNVDESLVSRDERNEYHGITVERARRVLDALGVRLVTRVEVEPIHAAMPARAGKAELASR